MSPEGQPYAAFGALSLVAVLLTVLLSLSRATLTQSYLGRIPDTPAGLFQPFFGPIPPLVVVVLVAVAGMGALGVLRRRGGFEISGESTWRGVAVAAAIATLFIIEAVPADLLIRFPRDMNVPPPQSLAFYPVIGYVVEVVFHALPLALLLLVLGRLFTESSAARLVWPCIVLVALLEPLLQVRWGFAQTPHAWAVAYVGLHLFAFNLLQLYVFRRYDFVAMYAFRLTYYLYWHIIWGYLRLQWLF